MQQVSVRYIVDDAEVAAAFYETHLDFELKMDPVPGFAMLSKGNLRLLLNAPGAGGARRSGHVWSHARWMEPLPDRGR